MPNHTETQTPPAGKKALFTRPVILTLLTLAVVVFAALLPKFILAWQDKLQLNQYRPLQHTGGTLTADISGLYYANHVRHTASLPPEETQVITEPAKITTLFEENLAPQLEEMATLGLLPYPMLDWIYQLSCQQGIILNLSTAGSGGYTSTNYDFTMESTGAQSMNFVVDADTGKLLKYQIIVAEDIPFEMYGDEMLNSYIAWLALENVADWEYPEPMGDLSTFDALSPSAGLSLTLFYYHDYSYTNLTLSVEPL